ncbi:hypothetical protein CQW23_21150 [Capsicum baccatum]|uniref:Uncharacterized protein n=1 Tax=Capsicum baccatum TaxID=33114 RepID=A0A2G2VX67_CAPBA|nr:hypothetical protein CQW23_21150 [Capsicum baccatum]
MAPKKQKSGKAATREEKVNLMGHVIISNNNLVLLFQLEDYCVSIVRRIKEFYLWPADVGELPMYLKHAMDSKDSDLNSSSTPSEGTEDELKAAAQDIASYQVSFLGCSFWVVLSRDGKIFEFQPTNRVAENQWPSKSSVKELNGKKKLVPGKYKH